MASRHASDAHIHTLHAALPPFSPLVPTRLLPLIAWSLLFSVFFLAFYFTTLPKKGLPLRELAVALVASILGGFGTVAMFCTVGIYV